MSVPVSGARIPSVEEADVFLDRFFSPPNATLERIQAVTSASGEAVKAWIAVLRSEPGRSVLLPFRDGERLEWYGLAFSARQFRILTEDVLGFIGPSYSTFRGGRGAFDPVNATDRLVLEFTGGFALKFSVPTSPSDAGRMREAADLMRRVVAQRVEERAEVPRPTGRVLRDFYMALRAGDRVIAERHLRYLEEASDGVARLSPLNVLFLRVQLLAELGAWDELVGSPQLGELLAVQRPLAVTGALIAAVYNVHLAAFEAARDAAGAAKCFREEIYPRFAGLLTSRMGLRAHEAVTMFMLLAVAGPTPDDVLVDELRKVSAPNAAIRGYRDAVAALLDGTSVSVGGVASGVDAASQALTQGDFERCFTLARETEPCVERTGLLLDSAYELHAAESAEWAALAVSESSAQEVAQVLSTRRRRAAYEWASQFILDATEDKAGSGASAVTDWYAWLQAVGVQPNWGGAQQFAREGAIRWSIEEFIADPRGGEVFAQLLSQGVDNPAVRLALPHLLEFFQNDVAWPRSELASVYEAMATVLVYSTHGGLEDYTVFYQLLQGLLKTGVPSVRYERLAELTGDLLKAYSAPVHLDWILDTCDLLVVSPCPAPQRRVGLFAEMATHFAKHRRHVTLQHAEQFRVLAQEIGQPEIVAALPMDGGAESGEAPLDPFASLGRQIVGVHTLTESAGRRFADVLRRHCPSVTVVVNHDHVGSNSLRDLARNADVMIVVTASAKHAASQFIEANRPSERALLKPAGKGTASMLRALTEHLARSAA